MDVHEAAPPWLAGELAGIGADEKRCGYSHDAHVHEVRGPDGPAEHRLTCLRRPGHEGAGRVVDTHIGAMPDGSYVMFDEGT